MPKSFPLRQLGLCCVALATLVLVRWLAVSPAMPLYAQLSPLATPWPTLIVAYPPQLPTASPSLAPTATAVRVHFGFASPLPTPTRIPDFAPPQTTLLVNGGPSTTGWYRSPVSVTFALTDAFGAGVTAYQLDYAPTWTDREYYYPPLTILTDGVHTLVYQSLDRLHNTEASQTAQIKLDRTPPQVAAPAIAGHQLPNGWYTAPVSVTLTSSDTLSGVAGLWYALDGHDWQAYTAPVSLPPAERPHTLQFRAVDQAGNVTLSAVYPIGVQEQLCHYSLGYWKNHAERWPVSSLTLGNATYAQAELLAILRTPPKGDATYLLTDQLIAALLNIANGVDGTRIQATLTLANQWLVTYPLGSDPQGQLRKAGLDAADTIEAFNRHTFADAPCDEEAGETNPPSSTPTVAPPVTPERTATPAGPVATATIAAPPTAQPASACTWSPGYWQTHSAHWPLTTLTLGNTRYTQAQLLELLRTPPSGDGALVLAQQLLASLFNQAQGVALPSFAASIDAANQWLRLHPVGSHLTHAERQTALGYARTLNHYNNGLLGPGHCRAAQPAATLHGWVWQDANHNGHKDPGEAGLAGVVVRLTRRDTRARAAGAESWLEAAITDEDGSYTFIELDAAAYRLAASVDENSPTVAISSTAEAPADLVLTVQAEVEPATAPAALFLPLVVR